LIYGMSAFGLARQLSIPRGDAQDYIDLYFERYPGVRAYMDSVREQAAGDGYVETIFGRRLYLPDITASNFQRRQGAERAAINAPMQGSAADIIKLAMIDVDGWLMESGIDAKMIMQVHDELVLEVREDLVPKVMAIVDEKMSSAAELDVPLVVESGMGDNWEVAH
jgi:DNA polymerase-1